MPIRIHFNGRMVAVDSGSGLSVLEVAQRAGWPVEAKCGGKGTCGRCNVMLGGGRYRLFGETFELAPEQRREVLSCQTAVLGDDADIFIPRRSAIAFEGARILDELDIPEHLLNPRFKTGLGVAVDVGTTTVVAALIDLASGAVLGRESLYNQQLLKADDVVSRISLCSTPGQLEILQNLVVEHTLNPLIHKLCDAAGADRGTIVHVALSGNTVMMHLFFGLSPVSIGVLPFTPLSRTFSGTAAALGIDAAPDAAVAAVPAISGYVGGDLVSDLHVSQAWENDGLTLLVDIGTNGEMVACFEGRMTACATAAGPAFEGAGLLHGMRAANGAIDTIRYGADLDFSLSVIGRQPPMGLCGSAIIDFIACGFRCGLINAFGRYDVQQLKARGRYENVCGMHACLLVPADASATGQSITVTEGDIAEVLKAKAAIYGGLKSLLAELGRNIRDLDRVILAGGFARHIDLANAIGIGLLPDIGTDRYNVIGNGSLAGAALALLDQATEQAYLGLIDRPLVVTLNKTAHFTNFYQEALAIPNLEEDDFPSVRAP